MPVLPAFGGKLNSTIAILRSARAARRSATQLGHARRQHRGPLRMRRHVAAAVAGRRGERPPNVIGQIAPSSSGIATIMVASTGIRPRASRLPLLQRLEFDRVRRDVGHVERRQHLFGGAGIVVGRAADQREAGQRDHRVDERPAALQEIALDRRPRVESAGEGRDDPQALGFQRRDHAVVVRGVAGEHVGAHHQQADHAGLAAARQVLRSARRSRMRARG